MSKEGKIALLAWTLLVIIIASLIGYDSLTQRVYSGDEIIFQTGRR